MAVAGVLLWWVYYGGWCTAVVGVRLWWVYDGGWCTAVVGVRWWLVYGCVGVRWWLVYGCGGFTMVAGGGMHHCKVVGARRTHGEFMCLRLIVSFQVQPSLLKAFALEKLLGNVEPLPLPIVSYDHWASAPAETKSSSPVGAKSTQPCPAIRARHLWGQLLIINKLFHLRPFIHAYSCLCLCFCLWVWCADLA